MFVKPSPGIKLRDPILKTLIPDQGAEVPESSFWLRRIRDGDVTVGQPTSVAKREVPRKAKGSNDV